MLATKFYNEEEALPVFIRNIAQQTLRPSVILFVNDGSTDRSEVVAREIAEQYGLNFRIVSMPKKTKGNLDTLGRAWTKAQPVLKELAREYKYVATADVDTIFPKTYFEDMVKYLDSHPRIGVAAGQIEDGLQRSFPMFTGKVVRSEVILYIDKYWDISIDSFLNIKALKLGYELKILDMMKVKTPPSHLESGAGRFRSGRLAFYAGIGPLYATSKAITKNDMAYMRGYWYEFFRGSWRCEDEDVREFYGSLVQRNIRRLIKRLL